MSGSWRTSFPALLAAPFIAAPLAAPLAAQCQIDSFSALDTAPGDDFGRAVAVDGTRLIVGAPHRAGGGGAYVFERSGVDWFQTAALVPATPIDGSLYGSSVGIDGELAAVGAPFLPTLGTGAGGVFVFRLSAGSWVHVATIQTAGDPGFGHSVSVSGDRIVVGTNGAGLVYVLKMTGPLSWQTEAILSGESASFGVAVEIEGERILSGDPFADFAAYNAGAAYVFEREADQWVEKAVLFASDGFTSQQFGLALSLAGDSALIGAPDFSPYLDRAAAYEFRVEGGVWTQVDKIAQYPFLRHFGIEVAHTPTFAVIGSNEGTSFSKAHVYAKSVPASMDWVFQEEFSIDAVFAFAVEGRSLLLGDPLFGGGVPFIPGAGRVVDHGLALCGSNDEISLATGGTLIMALDFGCCFGMGNTYVVAGSLTGTSPGTVVLGESIPLVMDAYTSLSLANPDGGPLFGGVGTLISGLGVAQFVLPPGLPPGLAGLEVYHAAVSYADSDGVIEAVSNAIGVELVP